MVSNISLELTLAAARGEPLEPPGGLERRIQRLREQLETYAVAPADAARLTC
jgi:hypothetical protein